MHDKPIQSRQTLYKKSADNNGEEFQKSPKKSNTLGKVSGELWRIAQPVRHLKKSAENCVESPNQLVTKDKVSG